MLKNLEEMSYINDEERSILTGLRKDFFDDGIMDEKDYLEAKAVVMDGAKRRRIAAGGGGVAGGEATHAQAPESSQLNPADGPTIDLSEGQTHVVEASRPSTSAVVLAAHQRLFNPVVPT